MIRAASVKGISSGLSNKIHPYILAISAGIDGYFGHNLLSYIILYLAWRLTYCSIVYIIIRTTMSEKIPPDADARKAALREAGALHPHPESVRDEAFLEGEFFDPNDLIQVKYEMLRRRREQHKSVTEVARTFGASRQAFYSAKALFDEQGIPGLIPKQRGPHGPHKCTDEVLDFAERWQAAHPGERASGLSEAIHHTFGITVNPRSVGRALVRRKKKRQPGTESSR